MTAPSRLVLLCVALAPYVALVGVDAWMHERARHVPRVEKILHYGAAVLFLGFVIAVFRDLNRPALALLAGFVGLAAWDELRYHRVLDSRERRVHFTSYAALVLFVGAWRLL